MGYGGNGYPSSRLGQIPSIFENLPLLATFQERVPGDNLLSNTPVKLPVG
jgi:hypothetical protein